MPPPIALLFCILFIITLFVIDFRRKPDVSFSLWISLIWLLVLASRPLALWFSPGGEEAAVSIEQGNPIDRTILSVLVMSAILVLSRRNISWKHVLKNNLWIWLFFLYCGISIFWSDFTVVSLKRWIRALGTLAIILVVLTEPGPIEAIKTLIRRCTYVLIPLSILTIKFYPGIGRYYNEWTGQVMLAGVTQNKNNLGRLCMICGIFFFWDIIIMRRNKTMYKDKKEMLINFILFPSILWLLIKCHSATSLVTFIVGCSILMGLELPFVKRNMRHIGTFFIFIFIFIFILNNLFNLKEILVTSLGRDPTLTDRTRIWSYLSSMGIDPVLGTGYDSLWLGSRLEKAWAMFPDLHLNEAHNGYLEAYLELGVIGILLFTGVLISAWAKIRRSLLADFDYGRIRVALLVVFLLYNVTEAAYKATTLVCFMFLLIAVEIPCRSQFKATEEMERKAAIIL